MSFEDWHYRKAEEYAHNEILAFTMMILGMNLLVGGLIVTVVTAGQANLFLFVFPQSLNQTAILGLILTVAGFSIFSAGFILAIHHDKQRSWHLGQIDKSTSLKNRKIRIKTANEILEELTDEEKRS